MILDRACSRAVRLALCGLILQTGYLEPALADSAAESLASETPIVRGPGISEEQLEAFAEAQAHVLLSDRLDALRPGESEGSRLRSLVERAQNAWLAGSLDTARRLFREIVELALTADWRDPQREAIHYACLRLAQSAPTASERNQWLKKAVTLFPDLQPDRDAFPPPLLDAFRDSREEVLRDAHEFAPFAHFPDHRYLLINGKRFVLTPDLRVRLPNASFRITAFSDFVGPMTETLNRDRLESYRTNQSPMAQGTCATPSGAEPMGAESRIAVLYASDCIRVRGQQGWLPKGIDLSDPAALSPAQLNSLQPQSLTFPAEPAPSTSKRAWVLVGLAALIAGSIYVIQLENTPRPRAARRK